MIKENIIELNERIEEALRLTDKTSEVMLLLATKTRSPEEINEALETGVLNIGENRVQELVEKYDRVSDKAVWHFIGHLQKNKVRQIIDKVSLIHSVDSIELAKEIDKRAKQINKTMEILIQVNKGEEENKSGVRIGEAEELMMEIAEMTDNIRIKGLMAVVPIIDEEKLRGHFRGMKEKFEELKKVKHEKINMVYLSMGMSSDYIEAIMEGANIVRIGSKVFGERVYI